MKIVVVTLLTYSFCTRVLSKGHGAAKFPLQKLMSRFNTRYSFSRHVLSVTAKITSFTPVDAFTKTRTIGLDYVQLFALHGNNYLLVKHSSVVFSIYIILCTTIGNGE